MDFKISHYQILDKLPKNTDGSMPSSIVGSCVTPTSPGIQCCTTVQQLLYYLTANTWDNKQITLYCAVMTVLWIIMTLHCAVDDNDCAVDNNDCTLCSG